MDILERALTVPKSRAALAIGYDEYLMTVEDAETVMSIIARSEYITETSRYASASREVTTIPREKLSTMYLIPEEDYLKYKMAALLGIPSSEINIQEQINKDAENTPAD